MVDFAELQSGIISRMVPPELHGTERFAKSGKESSAGDRMAKGMRSVFSSEWL